MKDDKFEKLSDEEVEKVGGGSGYVYKVGKKKYQVWNRNGKKVGTRKKELDAYNLAKDQDDGNIKVLDKWDYQRMVSWGRLDPYEDNQ